MTNGATTSGILRLVHPGLFSSAVVAAAVIASCGGGDSGSAPASTAASSPPGAGTPGSPPPPVSPAAAKLFFGVQTHFGQNWDPNLVGRLAQGGISDVRDELYWEVVEPSAGNFVFPPAYDGYMNALKAAAVNPLIELTFENSNYDGGQTPYTDAGFAAYAHYATTLLSRYGTQIKAVEVWNEYNGSFAKGPATDDRAGTYVKMLAATYAAVKAQRPDVTVVGGATAGVPLPYLEKLFAAGALNYLDAVSIHPYRYDSTPEGIEVQVAALRNLMASFGAAKPIWVTEIGWSLHPPAAAGDLNIDDATEAKFLVRVCALLASAGVQHVYWYDFRDDTSGPPMGLIANDQAQTARPALVAMKTLNAELRTSSFVGRDLSAEGVYSLRFATPPGRELRVLWALAPVTVSVPAGTSVTDLLGAPVPTSQGSLAVGDSPVFVSGPLPQVPGSDSVPLVAVTDSNAAFSLQQGKYGWFYGYFLGDSTAFQPMRQPQTTDWHEMWTDNFPYLSITSVDQHPSNSGRQPVAAVRRWVSTVAGTVRMRVHFKVGTQGDGVRVRVLVDGQVINTDSLNTGTSIARDYDFQRAVQIGTTFDFAVDPGPAVDINYDATTVSVTIERLGP